MIMSLNNINFSKFKFAPRVDKVRCRNASGRVQVLAHGLTRGDGGQMQ